MKVFMDRMVLSGFHCSLDCLASLGDRKIAVTFGLGFGRIYYKVYAPVWGVCIFVCGWWMTPGLKKILLIKGKGPSGRT